MAHYWTQTHPDLPFEEDIERIMQQHQALTQLLLDKQDGERSQIGARLFDELETLRAERDDRQALRESLARNEEALLHKQLLINELNHRVKNTLAIIQSIAMQTLRHNDTPPEVRDAFMARLMALANAHDIITAENWESAELGDVLTQAVAMLRQDGKDRVLLDGPVVSLEPRSAVAIAMAAHELATNAAKYGALSNDAGHIDIRWGVKDTAEAPAFWLKWTERGGPLVAAPAKNGFGARLVERGLASELNGVARLTYEPEGVVCTIEAPLPTIGTKT